MTIKAILTNGLGSVPWLLTEGYGFGPRVGVLASPKKRETRFNYQAPEFEPQRQIAAANRQVRSYSDEQRSYIRGLKQMAERQERNDPLIQGYQRMRDNGELAKMAKAKPQDFLKLEAAYRSRLASINAIHQERQRAEALEV